MGYELSFRYHPKGEDGIYKVGEVETFSKKIGKMDDVPTEKLVSLIMSQLARRDVMVFDVEIYEFVKKKVNFKMSDKGVIIKNKKVLFDGTMIQMESEPEIEPEKEYEEEIQVQKPKPKEPVSLNIAGRWEIYDGDNYLTGILAKHGKCFTIGKKYPIFKEVKVSTVVRDQYGQPSQEVGFDYITIDDKGKEVSVTSTCFVPEVKLSYSDMIPEKPKSINLNIPGQGDDFGPVPTLRR